MVECPHKVRIIISTANYIFDRRPVKGGEHNTVKAPLTLIIPENRNINEGRSAASQLVVLVNIIGLETNSQGEMGF